MSTWAHGRARLLAGLRRDGLALQPFIDRLAGDALPRAERSAVYPVADGSLVPQALLHNLKHNQVLHARNLVLTVRFEEQPWVPAAERLHFEALGHGFWRVRMHFGFMELPDVPAALAAAALPPGLTLAPMETSWFLSRETVVPLPARGLRGWRGRLFAAMSRGAGSATQFFRLPDNAVVELGTRVQV
jgi:KUP system potassium uptake protein